MKLFTLFCCFIWLFKTTLVFENKEFNLKNTNLTKRKRLRYVTLTGLTWVQCIPAS